MAMATIMYTTGKTARRNVKEKRMSKVRFRRVLRGLSNDRIGFVAGALQAVLRVVAFLGVSMA
jgi:hypothetical protein